MSQSQSSISEVFWEGSPWSGFVPVGMGGFHHADDPDERDWDVGPRDPGMFFQSPTPAFATVEDYEVWQNERDMWQWAGESQENEETARLLRALVDDLPPDVVALDLSASGRVLLTSTSAHGQKTYWGHVIYYPSVAEYQLPASEPPLPVVTRAQLTVVARLEWCVDKVVYSSSNDSRLDGKPAVFKYNPFVTALGGDAWRELQILARLPRNHPNILVPDALVVEELTGLGVIGFTTPWVPTPTLGKQWSFKLSWLRQLLTLVDQLHFRYGIHHQDLADRNIFVHPDNPGEILRFDFNVAATTEYANPARDDIKGAIALVYALITRNPAFTKPYFLPTLDEKTILRGAPGSWIKHPRVELDTDVSVIYAELMEWVRQRRNPPSPPRPPGSCAIRQAPQPTPPSDVDPCRPAHAQLATPALAEARPSRRILTTGRYVDEQEAYDRSTPKVLVPDSTRGFPQPPVVSSSPQKPVAGSEGSNSTSKLHSRVHVLNAPRGQTVAHWNMIADKTKMHDRVHSQIWCR
ncbi:hypothetical protein B0T18DRAFT_391474 [Schizothecium vesticola]|uniref:Uncharacterized protein n=1 Tax=Schizothecium vesticola TaxID=314040 RepID=A0AA40K6G2_9PEZI|nr:hypothetical protein B0T18DRAFT_391474 [Schizothecium vesticola]